MINNGGTEFDRFCKDNGIERHNITPYTPQHNVVIEQMNRTLIKMTRSMLIGANSKKNLQAKVVAIACY